MWSTMLTLNPMVLEATMVRLNILLEFDSVSEVRAVVLGLILNFQRRTT